MVAIVLLAWSLSSFLLSRYLWIIANPMINASLSSVWYGAGISESVKAVYLSSRRFATQIVPRCIRACP